MNKRSKKRRITATALLIILLSLLLIGCRTSQKAVRSKIDLIQGSTLQSDSVSHRWEVHRVTLYDKGIISKIDEKEQHNQRIITKIIRDTITLHSTDTLYIHNDAAPMVQTAKAGKSTIIWLVIGVALTLFGVGYLIRKKPP